LLDYVRMINNNN